ncbi:SET domain protein [Gymnopus androsaceus JB14]|uniref:SET domain protein n=1 Tax=Gymnopus androsaceus JB14 TaxID=1447944 RepID=A0A6A4IRJ9_9AGAR|nr:SET domain protein [Gymnopus androsaceus JB14]
MKSRKNAVEPSYWPKHTRYIQSYTYHPSVSLETKGFIQGDVKIPAQLSPNRISAIRPRPILEISHPACNQFGLFASKKILAKAHILDYIGELHCDERLESDYDLSLHRFQNGESVGIDASTTGNEARFINDYRGIKGKPNAVFIDYRADSGELRMGIWALGEDIKKGDEILVSYGKSWWKSRATEAV